MSAESYLNRIRKYDQLIEHKLEELGKWRTRLETTGGMDSGERVQSTPDPHRTENLITLYIEFEAEALRKIQLYSKKRSEIIDMIERLNGDEYNVIYLTYVEGLYRYEVAREIGKSETTVWALKTSALKKIEEMRAVERL